MLLRAAVNTQRPQDPSRDSETPTEVTQACDINFLEVMLWLKYRLISSFDSYFASVFFVQCEGLTESVPRAHASADGFLLSALKSTFVAIFRKHPA